MDYSKCIMMLCTLLTMDVEAYPSVVRRPQKGNRSKNLLGPSILKRKYCVDDLVCDDGYSCDQVIHKCVKSKCSHRRDCPSGLVCNMDKGSCEQPTTSHQIMNKQSCPWLVKQPCSTDKDCSCKVGNYVCEDNECVKKKAKKEKKDGERCQKSEECSFLSVCTGGLCMPNPDMMAMLMDMLASSEQKELTTKNEYTITSSINHSRRSFNIVRNLELKEHHYNSNFVSNTIYQNSWLVGTFCRTNLDCYEIHHNSDRFKSLQCIQNRCQPVTYNTPIFLTPYHRHSF